MKQLLILVVLLLSQIASFTFAANIKDTPFELIPEAKQNYGADVDKLGTPSQGKKFRNEYNTIAGKYLSKKDSSTQCDLGAMLSSGIVTRDTILCLIIRIVKVVANMALVIGAVSIIYAGYLYVVSALSGGSVDDTGKAKEAIKRAVIGVVIVVFSYGIQNIVTQAFLS